MSRSAELIDKRNKAIRERYKELYDIQRKRQDDVLKILENEFYLNVKTIFRIIFSTNQHLKSKKK